MLFTWQVFQSVLVNYLVLHGVHNDLKLLFQSPVLSLQVCTATPATVALSRTAFSEEGWISAPSSHVSPYSLTSCQFLYLCASVSSFQLGLFFFF